MLSLTQRLTQYHQRKAKKKEIEQFKLQLYADHAALTTNFSKLENKLKRYLSNEADMKLPSIIPHEMFILLGSTIRYSLGRQTYMVSLAPEMVMKYNAYLTKAQIEQIADEIDQEIQKYDSVNKTLGSKYDHIEWKKSVIMLRELAANRKEE